MTEAQEDEKDWSVGLLAGLGRCPIDGCVVIIWPGKPSAPMGLDRRLQERAASWTFDLTTIGCCKRPVDPLHEAGMLDHFVP